MRYLIIGGGGFIGSHLVDALLAQGQCVRVLERPYRNRNLIPLHPNLEWFEGDYGNAHDIFNALDGVDLVYHLASTALPQSSNQNPLFDIQSNLEPTICLLEQMRKISNVSIIFISSGGTVYGWPIQTPIMETHPTEPQCSYGIVKLSIEKYLALYNLLYHINYRVLRVANPYGPRQELNHSQGVIGVFLYRILNGQEIELWGDGTVVRDYVYIDDTISALLKSAHYQGKVRIFNIGSGRGYSVLEIIDSIERATAKSARINFRPKREFDVPMNVLCIQRARQELRWIPSTSLEAGLNATLIWLNTRALIQAE